MTVLHLATCSYREYHPEMGVPVGTSIGKNKAMPEAPQLDVLKPWTTFRKMADRSVEEQCERYQRQLDDTEHRVSNALHGLQSLYPDSNLVLLCWCQLTRLDTGPMGCHRRWLAQWLERRGVDVPEFGAGGDTPRNLDQQVPLF